MSAVTTYYPSLSCKFRIRFDESLHTNVNLPPPGSNSYDPTQAGLPAISAPPSSGGQTTGLPPLLTSNADQLSQIVSVVPLKCSVELPGFRKASRFSIDMLYNDFPLEPDVTRAIGVEIYLGTIDPSQWGSGNTQPAPPGAGTVAAGQNSRLSQIAQTPDNLLMYGLVDMHTVEYTDKGFRSASSPVSV